MVGPPRALIETQRRPGRNLEATSARAHTVMRLKPHCLGAAHAGINVGALPHDEARGGRESASSQGEVKHRAAIHS